MRMECGVIPESSNMQSGAVILPRRLVDRLRSPSQPFAYVDFFEFEIV